MSTIKLLDLPEEILEKILGYIPGHIFVSSVCNKFYELDCRIHRSLQMNIDSEDFEDDESILRSILSTNRIVESANFLFSLEEPENWEILKKIFKRHGPTMKSIKFRCFWEKSPYTMGPFKMSKNMLENLLNCFPSEIESLDLMIERNYGTRKDPGVKAEWMSNKIGKFSHLKHLSIDDFIMFNPERIPKSVESFKMTFLARISDDRLEDSTTREFSIALNYAKLLMGELAKRKLNNLEIECISWEILQSLHNIVDLNPLVKSFEVADNDEGNDIEFSNYLLKMKNLDELKVNLLEPEVALAISKMHSIKHLEIEGEINLSVSDLVNISTLEELTIDSAPNEQTDFRFVQNSPLKSLKIELANQSMNFFLQTFPKLENFEYSGTETVLPFVSDGLVFPNLKRLSLGHHSQLLSHNLIELLEALPNLQEFKVDTKFTSISYGFIAELGLHMYRFRKICFKTIKITKAVFLSDDSINQLQNISNAINSVELRFEIRGGDISLTELRELEGYFNIKQRWSYDDNQEIMIITLKT